MSIEKLENKCIKMTLPNDEGNDLVVKVKFFQIGEADPEQPSRTRVRFVRKRGDIDKWYSMFKDMKDAVLEDVLLAPQQAQLE